MKTYKVTVIEPGTSTFDPDLCFTKTVQATGRKDAQRKALIDERDSCYVSEVIVKENTMKLKAVIFNRTKTRTVLLDSGDGPLEARIKDVLPGMRVIGVFTYPALKEISIHVTPETK